MNKSFDAAINHMLTFKAYDVAWLESCHASLEKLEKYCDYFGWIDIVGQIYEIKLKADDYISEYSENRNADVFDDFAKTLRNLKNRVKEGSSNE